MTDIAREKYVHLMGEIENLEERIEELDADISSGQLDDTDDIITFKQEREDLGTALASKRNELARLSDGCGTPHTH